MNDWINFDMDNLPKELTEIYDVKSIKIGHNEKFFYRKREVPEINNNPITNPDY